MLNFQVFGESGTPLIIVHGLFGSIANWRGVARELAKTYKVYVIDQRNHGDSVHIDSMTYHDMASDLDEFIRAEGIQDFILCGHSMGGKTCMTYALSDAGKQSTLQSMVILDIAPVVYTHSHAPFLDALAEVDLTAIESRSEADKHLRDVIPDNGTRLFLLQSLERKDGVFQWRINIPVLQKFMPDIVGFPLDDLAGKSSQLPTLFLNGNKAEYVTDAMHSGILDFFPNTTFDSVDAGHWLHVEQRQAMIDSIHTFLK